MKCTACGNSLKAEANFCAKCGAPVLGMNKQKKIQKWIPAMMVGSLLLVGIAVFSICFLVKSRTETDKDEKIIKESIDEEATQAKTKENVTVSDDKMDVDGIINQVLGVKKLGKNLFELEYSCQKDANGYDVYVLSVPDMYGWSNYQYLDFDGDGEKELFVVTLENDKNESYFALHMLEKNNENQWFLADSVSKYDDNYFAETSQMCCPERCDIYMGDVDGLPLIYVESEYVASYFTDGIGVGLYQLMYKDGKWQFTLDPLCQSGSDVDYILSLNKETAIELNDVEYFEKFEKKFEQYGLKVEEGMYYDSPLYSQNANMTYVSGYNKYPTFTSDVVYNWMRNGATGVLKGVELEIMDSYQETHEKKPQIETVVDDEGWKKAYYDFLLSKDLSGYAGFSLLYVNEDTIPELYLYGNCEASGQVYATYSNGLVNEIYLGRLHSVYGDKQNIIVSSDGHMGYYYDIVYTMEDGTFVQVHSGSYNDLYDAAGNLVLDSAGYPVMEYKWDNQTVTAQEYQNLLSAAVSGKVLMQPMVQYWTSGDIISFLQGESSVANAEYIFPESDTGYLTEEQVAALSKEELRLARNEIYARHGYIFSKEDLKSYFESKSWYIGTTTEAIGDEYLNEFEIVNRDLIAKYEK